MSSGGDHIYALRSSLDSSGSVTSAGAAPAVAGGTNAVAGDSALLCVLAILARAILWTRRASTNTAPLTEHVDFHPLARESGVFIIPKNRSGPVPPVKSSGQVSLAKLRESRRLFCPRNRRTDKDHGHGKDVARLCQLAPKDCARRCDPEGYPCAPFAKHAVDDGPRNALYRPCSLWH